MIYITGDMHGPRDVQKFAIEVFPEQKKLFKEDYVIICGDFGLVWDGGPEEKYWLNWLENKSFTTL
ncbi:metallophosphoesterase, partial [Eubacteriales bacterium OttesenSCG-928-N14]|nr:metallophosphoesterase [Eubacteriales bacterium OttesenSCG-928-N14]